MKKAFALAVLISIPVASFALDQSSQTGSNTGSTTSMSGSMSGSSGDVTQNARKIFSQYDSNGDGRVSKEEFSREKNDEFARYDTNSDGVLSQDEHQKLASDTHDKLMGDKAIS